MFLDLITVLLLLIIAALLHLWAREQKILMAIIAHHLVEIKKRIK